MCYLCFSNNRSDNSDFTDEGYTTCVFRQLFLQLLFSLHKKKKKEDEFEKKICEIRGINCSQTPNTDHGEFDASVRKSMNVSSLQIPHL